MIEEINLENIDSKMPNELELKELNENLLVYIQDLEKACNNIDNYNEDEICKSITSIRRLLMPDKAPPIERVIYLGGIPLIVKLFNSTRNPLLQYELAWIITNIASSESKHVKPLVDDNILEILINVLKSDTLVTVKNQCLWALGNIIGDSNDIKLLIFDLDIIPDLIEFSKESYTRQIRINSTFALSNLCRTKPSPPLSFVDTIVPIFKNNITTDYLQIEILWALKFLSYNANDNIINIILDNSLHIDAINVLYQDKEEIKKPAISLLGNIVCADNTKKDLLYDAGCLHAFKYLLENEKSDKLLNDTCWALSNITAETPEHIQRVIDAKIFKNLLYHVKNSNNIVQKEAIWAISNTTVNGTPDQIRYIISQGCIKYLCKFLSSSDTRIITVCSQAISNIIDIGASMVKDNSEEIHPFIYYFDKCNGIEDLEELYNTNTDERIKAIIYKIFSKIFDDNHNRNIQYRKISTQKSARK